MQTKTSQARLYTFRLNPINPHEAIAMEQLDRFIVEGISFKQAIVDAICARAGATPEMFDRPGVQAAPAVAGISLDELEQRLNAFGRELRQELRGGLYQPTEEKAATIISAKASRLVAGIKGRQAGASIKYEKADEEA